MLHGGAYVQSLKDAHAGMMKLYSDNRQYEVYSLDYRVAPKNPYPAALEDALISYNLLISRGFSPENIIIAGDSAGGNLALALTFKLKELGQKLPFALVL